MKITDSRNKRYNAVKHGLLAKNLLIKPEDTRAFNKLARQLLAELEPKNAMELLLAEQIIIQYWRLKRVLIIENDVLFYAGQPKLSFDNRNFTALLTDFMKDNPSLDLLSRYNTTILKSFYRAIHEFMTAKNQQNPSKPRAQKEQK